MWLGGGHPELFCSVQAGGGDFLFARAEAMGRSRLKGQRGRRSDHLGFLGTPRGAAKAPRA